MTIPEVESDLSPEELGLAFLQLAIPKLPEAVSRRMLADRDVLSALGLPTGDLIRLWNQRFSRPDLLACLRGVANGEAAALASLDGKLKLDEARLDEDGAAALRIGTDRIRFANISVLGDDLDRRQRGLDRIVANGEMSPEREAMWRQAIAMGPLDDALFLALEDELGASPEAAYREMENGIADGSATFSDLAPLDVNHYAGLLNLYPPPATLGEFKAAWLARAATFDEVRLTRLLKLSGPLSVLAGELVAQASDRLPAALRLEVATYLQDCPDPFSVVAAFEIACRHRAEGAMRSIADALLPHLFDRKDALVEQGGATLAANVIATTAFTARNRTFPGWPLYARRLACFLNAGHLVRMFREADVDPAAFNAEVGRILEPQARLAELCDAREAPVYQARYLAPAFVHGLVASRVTAAIARIDEADRPAEWIKIAQVAIAADAEDGRALFLYAPGPFDELEQDWEGQISFPADGIEKARLRLASGADPEHSVSDLIKWSVAFEVQEEQRAAIAAALPPFIQARDDGQFLLTAEIGLQLAARWRDETLSDQIADLVLERARDKGLADAGAAPRLLMLAAAAVEAPDTWRQRAGRLAGHFAYVQKPGAPSINVMRALDLLGDMAPDLGPDIAPARAFATLTFDRLPPLSEPEDAAPPAPAPDQSPQPD